MSATTADVTLERFSIVDDGRERLRSALLNGVTAICPCHAVVNFRVSQDIANELLIELCRAPKYFALSLRALSELYRGTVSEAEILGGLQNHQDEKTVEAVVFVGAEIKSLRSLFALRDVKDLFAMEELVRWFEAEEGRSSGRRNDHPYVLGSTLSVHPLCNVLAQRLRTSTQFLARLHLLAPGTIAVGRPSRTFSHTTLLLVHRKLLGLSDVGQLKEFLLDPPLFLSWAIANGCRSEEDVEGRRSLAGAILPVLDSIFVPRAKAQTTEALRRPWTDHTLPKKVALPFMRVLCHSADQQITEIQRAIAQACDAGNPGGAGDIVIKDDPQGDTRVRDWTAKAAPYVLPGSLLVGGALGAWLSHWPTISVVDWPSWLRTVLVVAPPVVLAATAQKNRSAAGLSDVLRGLVPTLVVLTVTWAAFITVLAFQTQTRVSVLESRVDQSWNFLSKSMEKLETTVARVDDSLAGNRTQTERLTAAVVALNEELRKRSAPPQTP